MTGLEALDRHIGGGTRLETGHRAREDGHDDPLDVIWARRSKDHWHFVSGGLSELYDKKSPDHALSGWGFELTLRLAGTEDSPPEWPVQLLQAIARYTFDSNRVLVPGDHVPAPGTLSTYIPDMSAMLCIDDPGLGPLDGPFGRVHFVQLVAIREDEMMAVRNGRLKEVLVRVQDRLPMGISGPRPTVLTGPPPAVR